jgi:hypothetical protein
VLAVAGAAVLLAVRPASAQGESGGAAPEFTFTQRYSHAGEKLSAAEAGALLGEMRQLTQQALEASRAAERAGSVPEVKQAASRVVEAVWGIPSGVSGDAAAEVEVPGWKERWQVSGAEFDPRWAARNGTNPPKITDPRKLGIAGRGRAARTVLEKIAADSAGAPAARREAAAAALASINDVVGSTHVSIGYKGREVQPRVSLTQMWDMPPEYWNSTADTGWIFEAYAQAVNILKTDYAGEVATAREHAAALSGILQRVLAGLDADGNGRVEAKVMEGGLDAALASAAQAGLPVK